MIVPACAGSLFGGPRRRGARRDPIVPARLPEHGGVAVEIFGRAKPEGERDGGGIVDEPMQGGRRPAVLEPGEGAGVELYELAHRRGPGAAPVLGRAAGALGRPA